MRSGEIIEGMPRHGFGMRGKEMEKKCEVCEEREAMWSLTPKSSGTYILKSNFYCEECCPGWIRRLHQDGNPSVERLNRTEVVTWRELETR